MMLVGAGVGSDCDRFLSPDVAGLGATTEDDAAVSAKVTGAAAVAGFGNSVIIFGTDGACESENAGLPLDSAGIGDTSGTA